MLVNERNYSDAHIFPVRVPEARHRPGGGGRPSRGTGTAVWWESQIDPTLVFGIPQVGMIEPGGGYLENKDFVPDHLVPHHPDDATAGHDRQLEKAVEVLTEIAAGRPRDERTRHATAGQT